MPSDPNEYFFREYIQPGAFYRKDIRPQSLHDAEFPENQLAQPEKIWPCCVDVHY